MISRKLIVLFSVIFTVVLLAGCSSSGEAAEDSQPEENTEETKQSESSKEETTEADTQDSTEDDQKEVEEDSEDSANNVIDISPFEMGYDPSEITLQKGEEYELTLNNDGEVFHDLTQKEMDVEITYMGEMADHPDSVSFLDKVLGVKKVHASGDHDGGHDSTNIHMNAKSGQTVKIKFIPQEKGEFEFFCTVPGHKEAGMVGTFIVE
ncbi:plastocyanin/azurin family copper-binding protein [Halobacillus salinus]|uniref:plastocyanin/azurin family copper-binding protein n=1 Tax=Halobacillus salinus TaxID=192814 RepID=UPI00158FC3E2|nr:plastocyanin/azurin family copper-binding protein [Halobacillus salinus]